MVSSASPAKFGSPGRAHVWLRREAGSRGHGEELERVNEKGVVVIEGPTPPGFMQTVWRHDERFVKTYWQSVPGRTVYSTFDWGIRTKTATTTSWAGRRRHQCGWPPAGHARINLE